MKCCYSLSDIIADILALMRLLLFSRATARAERDLSSLSCVFLCVEWGHTLWDPIDTSLGYNWLPNQNAGL